jgi:hypothetical protein
MQLSQLPDYRCGGWAELFNIPDRRFTLRINRYCFLITLACICLVVSPRFCFAKIEDETAKTGFKDTTSETRPADDANLVFSDSLPAQAPRQAKRGNRDAGLIGIGVRLSTLGPGAEVAVSLNQKLNIRGGFNIFTYNRGFNHDGITYKGQLNLRSAEAHLDWYLFGHGFHLSPGLLVYNGNGATATANVPGGSTFSLGGTTYTSDLTSPIAGTGKLDFVKVAPTALFGFGNLVPRSRHFAVNLEMGAVFQGSARTKLNLAGNACDSTGVNCVNAATDPTVQANILAEQTKINNKLSPFQYYPVISIGFGYRF